MSMYYKRKLISGVREVPHMTLAQYNALTNKPDVWVRTDAPDSDRGISASDVEYSTGVSVKDKIDNTIYVTDTFTISSGYTSIVNSNIKTTSNILVQMWRENDIWYGYEPFPRVDSNGSANIFFRNESGQYPNSGSVKLTICINND